MKSIQTSVAEISFDEQSAILSVRVSEGAEMTMANTRKHYEAIRQLVGDRKHYALIDAANYFWIDCEVFEYASSQEVIGNRRASAHYNSTLGNSLTTNYFKSNYNSPIPVKIFKTREEALEWLQQQIEK